MVTATRGRVTVPVNPPKWSKPPRPPVPAALGDCYVCGERVIDLSPSPTRKPHLVSAIPCGCWLLPDEADEMGRE